MLPSDCVTGIASDVVAPPNESPLYSLDFIFSHISLSSCVWLNILPIIFNAGNSLPSSVVSVVLA